MEQNLDDKPVMCTLKGTLFDMTRDCMYPACVRCYKKVIEIGADGGEMFHCEKCQVDSKDYKWRMVTEAKIADDTGSETIIFFQEEAEKLFGIDAHKLGGFKRRDAPRYDQVMERVMFSQLRIRIKTQTEIHNGEIRKRMICQSVEPVQWINYGWRLVETLEKIQN